MSGPGHFTLAISTTEPFAKLSMASLNPSLSRPTVFANVLFSLPEQASHRPRHAPLIRICFVTC